MAKKPIDNSEPKSAPLTKRLEVRLTEEDHAKIAQTADSCNKSISKYVRELVTGHKPRQRLSDREAEALYTLAAARSDLIHIVTRVRAFEAKDRAKYFNDTRFVEQWMQAAEPLIKRWKEIEDYITED